jgi:hypothetical protein
MALLFDNSWECDYHTSYVISLQDKQAQLQCRTANEGNQYPDWLVNEAAPSGRDQLRSQTKRLMSLEKRGKTQPQPKSRSSVCIHEKKVSMPQ